MRRWDPSRRDILRTLSLLPLAEAGAAQSELIFTDVAAQAGLARARNVSGNPVSKRFLLEEMGGGVALFDYDNDGWLDIFLVNGSTLQPAVGKARPTSYLFRN